MRERKRNDGPTADLSLFSHTMLGKHVLNSRVIIDI